MVNRYLNNLNAVISAMSVVKTGEVRFMNPSPTGDLHRVHIISTHLIDLN